MEFFQIRKKNKIMIILVMQHLKEEVADKVEALVVQIFLIFLKIFLEILEAVEGQEVEAKTIGDQT